MSTEQVLLYGGFLGVMIFWVVLFKKFLDSVLDLIESIKRLNKEIQSGYKNLKTWTNERVCKIIGNMLDKLSSKTVFKIFIGWFYRRYGYNPFDKPRPKQRSKDPTLEMEKRSDSSEKSDRQAKK